VIDPTSADVYQNLSYLYELIGRVDDAIAAAKLGLQYRPGDAQITRNMKAAAMGRGNRLFNAEKYKEATAAYWQAIQVDPLNRYSYLSRISDSWLREAQRADAGPDKNAAFDSAATNFNYLFQNAPPESAGVRQSSIFNLAVISFQRDDFKNAASWVGKGLEAFPEDLELLGLAGQVRFQAGDYEGAVAALRKAVSYDARNPTHHQILFWSLTKLQKREESAAEYAMYKALSAERKPKTGEVLKKWVDAADNRLGPGNQIKAAVTADGYPDEVYTYSDDGKVFESWFYWVKGKSVTFMEGQVFSKGSFPAQKVN
jgi:tetratricopeptide (TPR) repeat protein